MAGVGYVAVGGWDRLHTSGVGYVAVGGWGRLCSCGVAGVGYIAVVQVM